MRERGSQGSSLTTAASEAHRLAEWRQPAVPGSEGAPAVGDYKCDGIDADCDGLTDEDFTAMPTSCGVGA